MIKEILKYVFLAVAIAFIIYSFVISINNVEEYDRAIIYLQNYEIIEVEIEELEFMTDNHIQITDVDGNVYMVNSVNCTLIKDSDKPNEKTFVQFDEFGRIE